MESRSSYDRNSKRVKVVKIEDEVVKEPLKPIRKKRKPRIKTIRLVLLRNKTVNIIGSVSGKKYTFQGAGSELPIDERDVPVMLAKGLGTQSCCGDASTSYFQVVQ